MVVKMRLLPANVQYSKTFHLLFSTLCKSVPRSAEFYRELARVRQNIKKHGIQPVIDTIAAEVKLSPNAQDYFDKMKLELPIVGSELQSRSLAFLLSLKD